MYGENVDKRNEPLTVDERSHTHSHPADADSWIRYLMYLRYLSLRYESTCSFRSRYLFGFI